MWIGWVLTKLGLLGKSRQASQQLPPRNGAFVDMHIGLLLLTIVGMGLIRLVDAHLLHIYEVPCLTSHACESSLRVLYQASAAHSPFLLRVFLDNLLVVLYSATLVTGFMIGLRRLPGARFLLPMLVAMVLCLAMLDLTENIYMMSWTEVDPDLGGTLSIASITATKFVLASVAVAVLLPLELWRIQRIFRSRWGL